MMNTRKLLRLAKKWQKVAALGRRRILSPAPSGGSDQCSSTSVANRGHLFVYSSDGKRFTIPLTYLSHHIFRELLRLSEEAFGLPSDGPIALPCDALCMEYLISLLKSGASAALDRAVLTSIPCALTSLSSLSLLQHIQQPLPLTVCG